MSPVALQPAWHPGVRRGRAQRGHCTRRFARLTTGATQKRDGDALDNVVSDPVLRMALREPVAFVGGMFAGVPNVLHVLRFLRPPLSEALLVCCRAGLFKLDLTRDPLREWVQRTAASASRVRADDGDTPTQQLLGSTDEGTP